mmetsp:Transcript_58911/g.170391  ORF Transcript_58911/g.170391 Transcript_58911/m.170391 type:complete len:203 (-) Transcript_58911:1040-1648(-)
MTCAMSRLYSFRRSARSTTSPDTAGCNAPPLGVDDGVAFGVALAAPRLLGLKHMAAKAAAAAFRLPVEEGGSMEHEDAGDTPKDMAGPPGSKSPKLAGRATGPLRPPRDFVDQSEPPERVPGVDSKEPDRLALEAGVWSWRAFSCTCSMVMGFCVSKSRTFCTCHRLRRRSNKSLRRKRIRAATAVPATKRCASTKISSSSV